MKVIISPAKTMKVDLKSFPVKSILDYHQQTEILLEAARKLSFPELKKMYGTSDKLTQINFERLAKMDLDKNLTPAIVAYQGQVYQHIDIITLSPDALDYLEEHLRIISGFYGLLKPFDGIVPYRLEMSNKLQVGKNHNLYEFWGDTLYRDLFADGETVINLASKEYFSVIDKYVQEKDCFLTIEFVKEQNGKTRQLGMMSKMARGEMIRYLAENQIDSPERLKDFTYRNLCFSEKYSNQKKMVFLES